MLISWGHRANSSISWQNGYLGKMGQSGVRPIGNLFWDIGLIASYLLYWSLVVYPMTSVELKYSRFVYYLMVGMVLLQVLRLMSYDLRPTTDGTRPAIRVGSPPNKEIRLRRFYIRRSS